MSVLEDQWSRCKHWIEAALDYSDGTHTIEDVKADIDACGAILWPGERSALVTQICLYPRKRFLTFWLAGGDMEELVNVTRPAVEEFASKAGFDRVTVPGRKGWERKLLAHGYEPLWSIVGKAVQ